MKNFYSVLAFGHDFVVAAFSVSLALRLRFGPDFYDLDPLTVLTMTAVFLTITTPVFLYFGLYRGLWHYASVTDLISIMKAVTVAILTFLAAMHLMFFVYEGAVPRSMPIIQWFSLIVMLGGGRFAFRLFSSYWNQTNLSFDNDKPVPVLLLGVSVGAEQFIRATRNRLVNMYEVVGIVDDTEKFRGHYIHDVPVLGKTADLRQIVAGLASKGKRPQRLIMTDQRAAIDQTAKHRLLDDADQLGLTLARLPKLGELRAANDEGKLELSPIALEDLLGRPQAALDCKAIKHLIKGQRVLVTGAGGTIGSELSRQIAALEPSRLTLLDFSEFNLYSIDLALREQHPSLSCRPVVCNIRERRRVNTVFAEEQPELVFHAAALKHVPMVELNPGEGIATNVLGTRNVADAAKDHGALAMVQVSTDKAVNPTSMMGASKRLAEFYCQALDLDKKRNSVGKPSPRFMTVRFGNVLGSSGSVVPLFQRQLANGGPLTVTHPEMTRYFMTVREAVQLILQASAQGLRESTDRGQIFVLDMGEPIRIVDIARQLIRLTGLKQGSDVDIKFTGLRPGEKLFEELFDSSERRLPAVADGVLIATSRPVPLATLNKALIDLEKACGRNDIDAICSLVDRILSGDQANTPSHQLEVTNKTKKADLPVANPSFGF